MDTETNGVRREWRDATAAQLARLEPEAVAKRKVIAERMLRAGDSWDVIRDATRAETGTAIGAGTIQRIRRDIDREMKKAERKAKREAAKSDGPLSTNAERVAIARRMLADGASNDAIVDATFRATGYRISPNLLSRFRREATPRTAKTQTPPKASAAKLPATAEVVAALLDACVPFAFDGTSVLLGGR